MSLKITNNILCISPYVSTSWSQISSLHMREDLLIITLMSGDKIEIPHLSASDIETIFKHHAAYVENTSNHRHILSGPPLIIPEELSQHLALEEETPFHFAFGSSGEGLQGMMMQHDPSQTNAPNLPSEILQKISLIVKVMGPTDPSILPKEEKGCNCFHCQIARALKQDSNETLHINHIEEEHEVSENDLHFENWTITQIGDNLYSVINKLDENEKYNVFLGDPIGCTCGKPGCEHILAVLKS